MDIQLERIYLLEDLRYSGIKNQLLVKVCKIEDWDEDGIEVWCHFFGEIPEKLQENLTVTNDIQFIIHISSKSQFLRFIKFNPSDTDHKEKLRITRCKISCKIDCLETRKNHYEKVKDRIGNL